MKIKEGYHIIKKDESPFEKNTVYEIHPVNKNKINSDDFFIIKVIYPFSTYNPYCYLIHKEQLENNFLIEEKSYKETNQNVINNKILNIDKNPYPFRLCDTLKYTIFKNSDIDKLPNNSTLDLLGGYEVALRENIKIPNNLTINGNLSIQNENIILPEILTINGTFDLTVDISLKNIKKLAVKSLYLNKHYITLPKSLIIIDSIYTKNTKLYKKYKNKYNIILL
jgi:hypothetical protein